jgi:hypothetical protein
VSITQQVIDIASAEVGYHEGKSADGHWNNKEKYAAQIPGLEWADWQAWCATFCSWVALKAGAADLYPRTASCVAGVAWFKKLGRFSEYPAVGAQVFYGPGGGEHTGIVISYDADYIYTVEGNTNDNGSAEGDGVYRKKRERRSDHVFGYGYPKFPEGIVSADPAYKGEAPKPAPAPAPAKPAPAQPAPVKPAPAKPNPIYQLSSAVKPGATHVQVRDIQELLMKLGYKIPGAPSNFYGKNTEAAVAAWHERNPKFKNYGVARDTRIGPAGYVALQKQCGRR